MKNKRQVFGSPDTGPLSLEKRDEVGRSSSEQITLSLETEERDNSGPEAVADEASLSPVGLFDEQPARPRSSCHPYQKKSASYNYRGAKRMVWSDGEKEEIFWCVTFARN